MKKMLKIRFNTKYLESQDPTLKWRILEDQVEHLVREIKVDVPCQTTEDLLQTGEMKWHLTCEGVLRIDEFKNASIQSN